MGRVFFNLSEKIARDWSLTVYGRRSDAIEDSEPVDRPFDRPSTERAHGETGVAVDRPEGQLWNMLE